MRTRPLPASFIHFVNHFINSHTCREYYFESPASRTDLHFELRSGAKNLVRYHGHAFHGAET